jgi:murein DD-endopeptidase MepM/ murein hydrolase activator NlpD
VSARRSPAWLASLLGSCALLTLSQTVLSPTPASAAKLGQRTLTQGMRGEDVRSLQEHLRVLKLGTKKTGLFNGQTKRAVKRLERGRRWKVDGRVQRRQAKRIKGMVSKVRARKRARRRAASGGQVFPVPGPHNFGGAQARFGAPRSGHSHQGQDIFAACGERLLSAQAGTVKVNAYQAGGAGYYLVVDGTDGYDYVYMHLKKRSWATPGTFVWPGSQVSRVGQSGNASGCHLHFELWTAPGWYAGGSPIDPYDLLLQWDSYS